MSPYLLFREQGIRLLRAQPPSKMSPYLQVHSLKVLKERRLVEAFFFISRLAWSEGETQGARSLQGSPFPHFLLPSFIPSARRAWPVLRGKRGSSCSRHPCVKNVSFCIETGSVLVSTKGATKRVFCAQFVSKRINYSRLILVFFSHEESTKD